MRGLLSRTLGRLSVGRKLLLIYLLDLTAVIFISGVLINEKFIAIDFARKELAGNAYIAQARAALLAVVQAAPGVRTGEAPAALVMRAEGASGAGMRSAGLSEAFAAALDRLDVARRAGAPDALEHTRREALDRGRELLTRIGNQSNLILDPDLDSYYTMSIVLLRLPELLDLGSSIAGQLRHQVALGHVPDAAARTQFFILEGRLDATAKGVESDYAEAFAAAADGVLGSALQPSRAALAASIERFRASARALLDGASEAELQRLDAAEAALLRDIDGAWAQSATQLDRLLQVRIAGFFTRMWLHLGTALALLALILGAVFFVARQIALPLRRLSDVVDTVRRTGDHSLRAQWPSGDEIGRLVLGFNDMLAQLDRERAAQQELAASARAAAAQQELVEAMPMPMMVTAVPGHEVLHANASAQRWLGGRRQDPWASGLDADLRVRFFQDLADRERVDEFEVRWHAGAKPSWAVLSARRLRYQGQDAVLTAFAPINHLKQMEQRLALWAKVFETSSEGIVIVDGERRIVSVNRALSRATGYDAAELIGQRPDTLVSDDAGSTPLVGLWLQIEQRDAWQGEVQVRRRDGSSYPAWLVVSVERSDAGRVSHVIFASIDISERKASEQRIQFLAQHDVLTELPNRSLCSERLRLALQQAQRSGHKVGVLFIDLDRFKNINDSLGHHVGDALLRSVARRLLDAVRAGDTVSRLGGDEFVVVLNGVAGADEITSIVEHRLVPLIRRAHDIDGAELHVSCSVGVAIYPDDAHDIDSLMRHADAAMYHAKFGGRDRVRFFTAELNERAQARLRLESSLRHAIERRELQLHYQPRMDARGEALVGVEALLRWQGAEGPVSPAQFIPIAEDSGLIVPIGAWVIEEACRQQARWRAAGLGTLPVSINLSALQLRDAGLVASLREALHEHAVPGGMLELELTESMLMDRTELTLQQLHALKGLGLKLAIDDFGTGYSSLNYLNRLPIDKLKIDRSFVQAMQDDPAALAITRAIIGLGHALGLQVVAEGVERAQQVRTLRAAKCDELQGYHFARPMPADALVEWIAAREATVA
ncbi:MAG: EAL domain-containing protein [Betaproteobacteria bacterium]|nr:MAG: EAL domain-containing protein [Betaproteobacteria bacterium]